MVTIKLGDVSDFYDAGQNSAVCFFAIFWTRYSVTLGFSCRMAKKMPLTRRGE